LDPWFFYEYTCGDELLLELRVFIELFPAEAVLFAEFSEVCLEELSCWLFGEYVSTFALEDLLENCELWRVSFESLENEVKRGGLQLISWVSLFWVGKFRDDLVVSESFLFVLVSLYSVNDTFEREWHEVSFKVCKLDRFGDLCAYRLRVVEVFEFVFDGCCELLAAFLLSDSLAPFDGFRFNLCEGVCFFFWVNFCDSEALLCFLSVFVEYARENSLRKFVIVCKKLGTFESVLVVFEEVLI
jgi:hypothetical protein